MSMVQPTARILSTADAEDAARALETPSELRQFMALANESGSVRAFLDTPEWAAIHGRIMGDGKPPTGRPHSLGDVVRFIRWTADGQMGGRISPDARAAYLHCAVEVEAFARRAERTAPVSPAPARVPAVVAPAALEAGSLPFGEAMNALRSGRRVTRAMWPSGSYVTAQAGYPAGIGVNANTAAATGLPQGSTVVFAPYLMRCLRPQVDEQPPVFAPWAPDQADLFADDWRVLADG